MKNNERLIQYFDVSIHGKTRAKGITHNLVSPRSLGDLISDFNDLSELGLARRKVSYRSKLEFRLEDIEEKSNCWVILINVVDGDAAHPVTQKIGGTGADREVIELNDGRGLESSTHVVIMKTPDNLGKHLTLCERSANISFGKIISFLRHLSKEAANKFEEHYTRPHPNGAEGKTIKTYCVLAYLGHPSDEFRQELDEGKLSDLRLTSDADIVKGVDSNAQPELFSTEIRMSVKRLDVLLSGGNMKHIKKAISYANTLNAPYVRVQFNDSSGTGRSAIISSDSGQLWNADKYVKKSKIEGFGNSLNTAFPSIHSGIRDKMLELLQ